jgi:ABC-type antimicrobial peptide transport system permease subunit
MLINETMARRFWPNDNPIGKRVSLRYAGRPIVREIVGVVGDVRQRSLELPAGAGIFLPLAQVPTGSIMLVVRTDPAVDVAIIPAIRNTVKSMNADLPIARTGTLEQLTEDAIRFRRFVLLLLGSFAATALALAIVGVYGLIAQSAAERTHELGIRLALGASRSGVLSFMLREALSPAAVGVVVGIGASAALTGFLRGMLYHVAPIDVTTFTIVSVSILALAAAASFAPAWRATRVDPLTALRKG